MNGEARGEDVLSTGFLFSEGGPPTGRRLSRPEVAPSLRGVKGALETPHNSCGMVEVVEDLP